LQTAIPGQPLHGHELHDRLTLDFKQFQEASLKLREVTRQVISSLEQKSGYPVEVMEHPALPTLATIRIARGNIPAHILSYQPGAPKKSMAAKLELITPSPVFQQHLDCLRLFLGTGGGNR
jgi:hypothetical protein